MANALKNAIDCLNFKRVIFLDNIFLPPKNIPGYITVGAPRLLFPVSGKKELMVSIDGQAVTVELQPGDAMFIPPGSWTRPLWQETHTMISLTYYPTHIRVLFIDHKSGSPPPPSPNVYHHSPGMINLAGQNIIQTLTTMTEHSELRLRAENLIAPLLELSLLDLNSVKGSDNTKAYLTWCEVLHCIMENYHKQINCRFVAQQLRIDAGYVSKLLKKFTGMGFSEYLNQIRITNAELMLKDPRITLDEIAYSCGYKYTSYFIRVFRKVHGISPSQFRQTC